MTRAKAQPMDFGPGGPLRGKARLPGDKSISHRALILAALARGRSRIEGLSPGEDVARTARALRAMGVGIVFQVDGGCTVDGLGPGGLMPPAAALDLGNSGTSARLLMGVAASHPIRAVFIGDASLTRRPMERVTVPLRRIGAEILSAPGERLPILLRGAAPAVACTHRLVIPSAQVKSALLLAGLNAPGTTRVIEKVRTRDHLERLLARFGAELSVSEAEGERHVALRGEAELAPQLVEISGDPSSAAFLAVAALIVPGSEIVLDGVCVNPLRMGLFEVLRAMGGDIRLSDEREVSGEPVADLHVRHSALTGVDVPPELVPAMIDEFPIFFIAAAFAAGRSSAAGLGELRVKESDRLRAMADGLRAIGVHVEDREDGLAIQGSGGAPLPGGARIASRLDHRVAMSFAVAGLRCAEPLGIDDMSPVATSFPGFVKSLRSLCQ